MKKKLFSLLVLLMTAVTGAVAQSYEAKVFDVPASWEGDQTKFSAADLPEDFVQITTDEAKALAVPDGLVILIYGFENGSVKDLDFDNGTYVGSLGGEMTRGYIIGVQTDYNAKICYPAPAPAGPEVTWDKTTKTGTFTMPVFDVELQVEYYPAMLSLGGDAIEGGTVEVIGLTGDALPAGFEKDAEGNIYVAQGTTFTVKATPEEGYHLVSLMFGQQDITDQVDADGIATLTMPEGDADLSLTATFAENEYDITFSEGTNPDPEHPEWTATPNPAKTKQTVTVTYTGSKKVIGVKAEKKAPAATGHPLSASAVGEIVCSDGLAYAAADKDKLPQGVTAVAMVAYKGASAGSSLAIALTDEGSMNWSTAKSTCEGKDPIGGNSWRLPSSNDWQYMFIGCGGSSINDRNDKWSYGELMDKLTAAGGTALKTDYYWSSTEENPGVIAQVLGFSGSIAVFTQYMESVATWVRACLAF